jgi:hypothetical protein
VPRVVEDTLAPRARPSPTFAISPRLGVCLPVQAQAIVGSSSYIPVQTEVEPFAERYKNALMSCGYGGFTRSAAPIYGAIDN